RSGPATRGTSGRPGARRGWPSGTWRPRGRRGGPRGV
ncbi:MAG: hypothetical protein AVDCRST_MAG49-2752, partial [uncultured Thermomicrobiales bacterium]